MSDIIRNFQRTGYEPPSLDKQTPPLQPKPYMNILDHLFLEDGREYYLGPLPLSEPDPERPPLPGEPYYEQWLKTLELPPGQRLT